MTAPRETPLRYCDHCEAWHPRASWDACGYQAHQLRARVTAVEQLLEFARRVSPSPLMTVEVAHVQEALDTGQVPDMVAGKKTGQAEVKP